MLSMTLALASILMAQPPEVPKDVRKIQRAAAPEYAPAIARAVALVGRPELEHELWRVCRREGWCGRYGVVRVHRRDAWVGKRAYWGRVRRGDLDPENCPLHRITEDRPVEAFATRGGFGTIAAGVLHLLGECVGPEALDSPSAAAEAAARVMASCVRWERGLNSYREKRSCTCPERARRWAGGGKWDARTNAQNRRASIRQCGEQPPLSVLENLDDFFTLCARSGKRVAFEVVGGFVDWEQWRTQHDPALYPV